MSNYRINPDRCDQSHRTSRCVTSDKHVVALPYPTSSQTVTLVVPVAPRFRSFVRSRSTVGQSLSTTAAVLAGIAVALCTLELAVRPFATPYGAPAPNIAVDSADAPVVTVRQLDEGIAESHFSVTGARLTGNERILNAPTVVL